MKMLTKLVPTAIAALAVVAPANAATKTVNINKDGFSPVRVTIAAGDSVKWVNKDSVNRQIVANGGQFASPVLRPGQTYTRKFDVSGTYRYHDTFKPAQSGTVVVSGPPPSISLAASAPIITFGQSVTLGGRVSSGKAGEQITVYGKPYGQLSYVQLATVLTADGGAWSYSVKPELLTTYQAQWKNLKSAEIQTAVAPKLTIKRVGAWFVAKIQMARSFRLHWVYVQRRSALGQWVNIRKVLFGTATSQRFKLRSLPRGKSRIRLFLTVNQAGVGYLASSSNTIIVRRR